ncbi:hypothetical protein PLIIFM63780_002140 [Purpureocillium lilacinum]|uniref:Uncharacterized protein n=1 Tax=Purpureocillium lilacinum TaxID=33203 RepID=A0A2U3DPE9_PURLI|nr:hypothetical protein PCL_12646 [Purpureocillium lilacinum]GJN75997.1 hypothetical protein PLICBS_010108 [Purpureocillium lilacinum]GJN78631.1 hypothetical protein PLIIFM63780_002140 [Purpureocillium lilacinum]
MKGGNPVVMLSAVAAVEQGRLALLDPGANPGPLVYEETKDHPVILDEMDGTDGRAKMGAMAGMGVPETMDGMVEMAGRDMMGLVAHLAPRVLKENRDVKVTLALPECKVLQVLKGHLASKVLLENRVRQGHRGRKAGLVNGGKFV